MLSNCLTLWMVLVSGYQLTPSVGPAWDPAPRTGSALGAAMPAPAMLQRRILACTLGRITNYDPSKAQAAGEFLFEGDHGFVLDLPSIPVRTTPPPESTQPPEPVDPRTMIMSDPDHLARGPAKHFTRIVDDWPERVELSAPVSDIAVTLIIIDQIDVRHATANLFLTTANDAVTYDVNHLYAGKCAVSSR